MMGKKDNERKIVCSYVRVMTRVLILGVWPAKFENMDLTRI